MTVKLIEQPSRNTGRVKRSRVLSVILASLLLLTPATVCAAAQRRTAPERSLEGWRSILSLFFLTVNDGWLVDLKDEGSMTSTVYRTANGGQNWKVTGQLPFPASRIQFIDTNHGWVTSGWAQSAAATTDGGASWKIISLTAALKGRGRGMFSGMEELVVHSKQAAWLVMKDQLLTTDDGGLTWNRHPDLEAIASVTRVSDAVGLALSVNCTIYRTDDGGAHWIPLAPHFQGSSQTLNETPRQNASGRIRFSDERRGWLFLNAAKQAAVLSFRTEDGGRTWVEANIDGTGLATVASVYDVQLRHHSGWMVSNTLPDKDGIVFRYLVLMLDDGRWTSCGQADTLNEIQIFAGVPLEFVLVRDGKTKLVRYECKNQVTR